MSKSKSKSATVKSTVLKVSKATKIGAAFASLRGVNHRAYILAMGEAEDAYKRNGRLILGGKAE